MSGWVAGAVVVGGIAGSVISSQGAQSAAQTQADAANNATQTQLGMFQQTQQNLAPYMASGKNALGALNTQMGIGADGSFNPNAPLMKPFSFSDYQKSPGYDFKMGQGIDAVQNSAAARGGIGGGNTLRALTQFGQGLANTDYQQAYDNYVQQQQQRYGMLSNAAGSGQNAAAGLGAIGTQVGGQIGSNMIGAGNARAAGQVGAANAWGGGLNSLSQMAFLNSGGGFMPNNAAGYGGSTAGWFNNADLNSIYAVP